MVTLKAIQEKIAKLQAQAEAIAKKESSEIFGKIRDLMERHGLTPDDIAAHFRQPAAAPKSTAAKKTATPAVGKYVHPKTGATWTGHGRAPAWIANVKDRSRFLVEKEGVATENASKKTTKSGNYARGPQAPKYRDPVSGATWSGRGPAPAWLASAKERNAYLIEKPEAMPVKAESVPSPKAVKSTKAVAVKTASAKKATTKTVAQKSVSAKSTAKKATAKTTVSTKKSASSPKKLISKQAGVKRASVKVGSVEKAPVAAVSTPASEQRDSSEAGSA